MEKQTCLPNRQISLKTLPEFTKQEVFEYVCTSLLKQNCRSTVFSDDCNRDICMYRGNNNTKCAAGFVISDEEYNNLFEQKSFRKVTITFFEDGEMGYAERKEKYHFNLIEKLQIIHDDYEISEWKYKFMETADIFSLDTKFLENIN